MKRVSSTVLVAALALAAGSALAQPRHDHRGPGGPAGPAGYRGGLVLDQRYRHDHYYPARGASLSILPRGTVSIGFGGGNYFFHGGVWFRPLGGRFVVVVPPVGIFVPLLPPAYVTLWIGGVPYYYADGVYYAAVPGQGYQVVGPPPGADAAQPGPTAAAPTRPEPVIYPRNGQSAQQTEADRQECNRWATTQPAALADADVFQRAVAACMDARGYTLR